MTDNSGFPSNIVAKLFDASACQTHPDFRDLLNALPCGVYARDSKGSMTCYNEHSVRFWGRNPKLNEDAERFFGSLKLFSAEGQPISHDQFWMTVAQGNNPENTGFEIEIERPGGERVPALAYATPIHDAHGAFVGAVCVLVDIAGQKKATAALRKREQWFSKIFRNALNGIAIKNWEGQILQCNSAYCKLLGYSEAELCESEFLSLIHPEDRSDYLEQIRQLRAGDVPHFKTDSRYLHKDGNPVWVRKIVSLLPADDGAPPHLLNIVTDISERLRAEAAIRESQEQFRTLIRVSSCMVWTAEANGLPDDNSPAWLEFTGQQADKSKRFKWFDAVHPEDRDRVRESVKRHVAASRPIETEFRVLHHSGEWRWMAVRSAPVFDGQGKVRNWIGMSTDITDSKTAEEQIRINQAELAHDYRREMVSEMGSAVAHELDQPLTVILSGAEACARLLRSQEGVNPELIESLDRVVDQAERAGKIVNRLKAFLRNRGPRRSTVDINAVIRDAVELARLDRAVKGVEIVLDLDPSITPILLDSIQISQVIVNLLRNAFDAVVDCEPARRKVVLQSRAMDDCIIRVSIRDFGVGYPQQDLDRMFASFYTTKRDQLGVGLSLSRSLVEAHGGRLWAEANPDYGLTFRLTIPKNGKPAS